MPHVTVEFSDASHQVSAPNRGWRDRDAQTRVARKLGGWVIGADGGGSVVRKSAGIGFDGFTYPERFALISMIIAASLISTPRTDRQLTSRLRRWKSERNDPREVMFPTGWQTPIYAWSFDRASLARKKEKIDREEIRFISLTATGDDWFGPHFISFECDIPEAGEHAIYIEALKGPAQALVQLFSNQIPVAAPVDLYSKKL